MRASRTPVKKSTAVKKQTPVASTMVAIIGAGHGGTALIEIFAQDPLVQIVGIAEVNPKAPGIKLARRLKIPIVRNYRDLLAIENVDLIIDVSGNPSVEHALEDFHRMGVTIIGGASASAGSSGRA